jgi:hypothetical protein
MERRFARAVFRYFKDQGRRIVESLRGHGTITPVDVANAIDWDAEPARFVRMVIRPQLFAIAATGVKVSLQQLEPAKSLASFVTKDADEESENEEEEDDGIFIEFDELPPDVRKAILDTLDASFRSPSWTDLQTGRRDEIQEAIQKALEEGKYHETPLSKAIMEATGGAVSRGRAKRIARTEATGALNSGHAAAIESLNAHGLRVSRRWLAIMDKDTRHSHRAMNNVIAPPHEMFHVGPTRSPAPYPGWHDLPGGERVNCRCTIIAHGLTAAEIEEMEEERAREGHGKPRRKPGRGGKR